jgi:septum site-determining protein MinC
VIQLWRSDLDAIEAHLRGKIEQAPALFQNVPVVIDLADLSGAQTPDFSALRGLLQRHGLIPVGVRNVGAALQDSVIMAGLPVLRDGRVTITQRPAQPAATPEPKASRNRLHTQPIRSGQQIYAADGDLIVIGTVSVGAEVLADGNIHVYGALRGRALAGVRGDSRARIFCQSLEAQLVSIAGNYRILDEPDESDKNQARQIYLDAERLIIEPLAR